MAVVSVNILHNGWGASEDVGKKTTFTVVYLVEVDDKNDGALIVMDAADSTTRIPRRFETYAVGNDVDPFAFVKSKSPTPIDDKLWHVTVTFGPNEPSGAQDGQQISGLDDKLQPTDDPTREVIDVSVTVVSATRAAERGAYIEQIDLPIGNQNVNDPGHFKVEGFRPGKPVVSLKAIGNDQGQILNGVPITNSVFTPFDPPPEIAYNQFRITAGMNCDHYPGRLGKLVNSVNDRQITLDAGFPFFRFGFGEAFPPYTVRFMGFNTQKRFKNGFPFWRLEIEFLVDRLFGWRLDILDRGYCVNSNNTSEGAPIKNNIVDDKGNQIAEPLLLDGNGEILDIETHAATYLRYAVYPEIDFRAAGLSDFDKLKMEFTNNG